eukprot:2535987-Amphidinium_carterae.1
MKRHAVIEGALGKPPKRHDTSESARGKGRCFSLLVPRVWNFHSLTLMLNQIFRASQFRRVSV